MSQSTIQLAEPSGTIAHPEVASVAKRRRFPKEYKLSILAEADQCHQRGQIGMLLRREGLYSWHLKYFREWRANMPAKPPAAKPSATQSLRNENARLKRETERLKLKLKKAEGLLELQKKVAEIYQNEIADHGENEA